MRYALPPVVILLWTCTVLLAADPQMLFEDKFNTKLGICQFYRTCNRPWREHNTCLGGRRKTLHIRSSRRADGMVELGEVFLKY
jgi:hypothetical protein